MVILESQRMLDTLLGLQEKLVLSGRVLRVKKGDVHSKNRRKVREECCSYEGVRIDYNIDRDREWERTFDPSSNDAFGRCLEYRFFTNDNDVKFSSLCNTLYEFGLLSKPHNSPSSSSDQIVAKFDWIFPAQQVADTVEGVTRIRFIHTILLWDFSAPVSISTSALSIVPLKILLKLTINFIVMSKKLTFRTALATLVNTLKGTDAKSSKPFTVPSFECKKSTSNLFAPTRQ